MNKIKNITLLQVRLKSFQMNVKLHRFHPQTQKLEPQLYTTTNSAQPESSAQYLPNEWSHFRFRSTDSKVSTTFYRIINSNSGKYFSSFQLKGHTLGFHPQHKSQNHIVQRNKQLLRELLLNSFHLNGHTLGSHPQTQYLEPPCTA